MSEFMNRCVSVSTLVYSVAGIVLVLLLALASLVGFALAVTCARMRASHEHLKAMNAETGFHPEH